MQKALVVIAAAVLAAGATLASPQSDVMATVNQFVDSFNKGDSAKMAAACAAETSILDEFPPYEWHGAGACARWIGDYDADAKRNGITEGVVTLSKPRHVDITGDRAYVVVPADYTYKMKGKKVKETGSMLTIVLVKGDSGWKITGWTWSKH